MEDVLTAAPPPSRFFADDLEIFASPPPSFPPPLFLSNSQYDPIPNLLIVFISAPSLSLLRFVPKLALSGTLILPELPLSPYPTPRSLRIYSPAGPNTLVAAVHCRVPSDRAKSVAKTLINGIKAKRIVIFDSLKGGLYRGTLPADEPLGFKLETTAEKKAAAGTRKLQMKFLPSGSVADGLGASLLSECQIKGIRGTLVLTWPDYGYVSPAPVIRYVLEELGVEVGGALDAEEVGLAVNSDIYS